MINENKSFLNRNKAVILAALGGLVLGTGLFLNLNTITQLFQQNTGPIVQAITPAITQIQQFINQIPSEWRSIILITVPTAAVGLVINWWRSHQMNKMAEASLNKIQELNSAKFEAETVANKKIQSLTEKVNAYELQPNLTTTVSDLKTQLGESKEAYDQVWQQYQTLQRDYSTLQSSGNIDYVRLLQATLKTNNIPIPQPNTNTITLIK